MSEHWRSIADFEGLYEISDLGRVRSLDRIVQRKDRSMHRRGQVLRPGINSDGYRQAKLSRSGVMFTRTVHSLVAQAFIGSRPEGLDVLHGPGGKLDNRVENLRYGTPSENMADTVRDGTSWWTKIEACLRGHRLEAPNLMPSALPSRGCLACNRGHGAVRQGRRRGVTLDLQAEADRHYSLIMSEL